MIQCFLLVTKSAFHLPKLIDLAGQSVNQTHHFEGMMLANLEK